MSALDFPGRPVAVTQGAKNAIEPSWGRCSNRVAVIAAYVWLALAVWTLLSNGTDPNSIKAVCCGCWLAVGFWAYERTDRLSNGRRGSTGLLTVFWGALALCVAVPLAALRKTR